MKCNRVTVSVAPMLHSLHAVEPTGMNGIQKNEKRRAKLKATIEKHRKALEDAEKQLSNLNATKSATVANAVGKRGWKCSLMISGVERQRTSLGMQGFMVDMSLRVTIVWSVKVALTKDDEVTDVEGAMAEAVNKFVKNGTYSDGTYDSDAFVVSKDAPTKDVPMRLIDDLQYYCDDYPHCGGVSEVVATGTDILFKVMTLVHQGEPTRTHDWGPEEDEEPVYRTSAGGFRYATYESPVPSVSVVNAVFASGRASAPTGALPPQPRTFKPNLSDVEEELKNVENDIERPQDLTPEKVQEMIRKGELPPPSKRPQPQLPPPELDDDDGDDEDEDVSWEKADREMARLMNVFEERDKERAARTRDL